jgi:hypothetical protein
MNSVTIKTGYLPNGNSIAYHSDTEFKIQIGKDSGKYANRYTIKGNLSQALLYYHGINIGNGYKKRLVCESMNKPLLLRQFS